MKVPIKLTIPLKVKIKMCQVHLVQCAGARQRYNPPRPRHVLCIVFPITGTSASRLSYLESHDWVPKVLQNSQIKSTNNLAQCLSPPLARTPWASLITSTFSFLSYHQYPEVFLSPALCVHSLPDVCCRLLCIHLYDSCRYGKLSKAPKN